MKDLFLVFSFIFSLIGVTLVNKNDIGPRCATEVSFLEGLFLLSSSLSACWDFTGDAPGCGRSPLWSPVCTAELPGTCRTWYVERASCFLTGVGQILLSVLSQLAAGFVSHNIRHAITWLHVVWLTCQLRVSFPMGIRLDRLSFAITNSA